MICLTVGAFQDFDLNLNGRIDYSEFCNALRYATDRTSEWQRVLDQCFEVFDRVGDGHDHESHSRTTTAT